MQNFAQMSKTMSSVQKELNDLKSDRSRVKSPAASRKRGRDKIKMVRHLHVRNIYYPELTNKVTTIPI